MSLSIALATIAQITQRKAKPGCNCRCRKRLRAHRVLGLASHLGSSIRDRLALLARSVTRRITGFARTILGQIGNGFGKRRNIRTQDFHLRCNIFGGRCGLILRHGNVLSGFVSRSDIQRETTQIVPPNSQKSRPPSQPASVATVQTTTPHMMLGKAQSTDPVL